MLREIREMQRAPPSPSAASEVAKLTSRGSVQVRESGRDPAVVGH